MEILDETFYDHKTSFYYSIGIAFAFIGTLMFHPFFKKNEYRIHRNLNNPLILFFLTFLIAVCTSSLINWFSVFKKYTQIENYIFLFFVSTIISTSLSIIEWIIYLKNKASFLVQSQYYDSIKEKSTQIALVNLKIFHKKTTLLNKILLLVENNAFILERYKKANEIKDKKLKEIIHKNYKTFEQDFNTSEFYSLSTPGLYFIVRTKNRGAGHMVSISNHSHLIFDDLLYNFENDINKNIYVANNDEAIIYVKELIYKEINAIEEKIIFEQDYKEGEVDIPITDFIFNNLYELFSIRQGYLIPNSNFAKIVHIIFGIYKYLFLGTLATLIIKK